MKQAIRELNEHYSPVAKAMGDKKEKDMKEEKDKYEFDMQAWDYWWSPSNTNLVLLRKKPRVEDRENTPVKVEYDYHRATPPKGGDCYYLVQFRVTGWDERQCPRTSADSRSWEFQLRPDFTTTLTREWESAPSEILIGLDARDKWSAPVLLPKSVYSRLDEICRALQDRANGGKG